MHACRLNSAGETGISYRLYCKPGTMTPALMLDSETLACSGPSAALMEAPDEDLTVQALNYSTSITVGKL